LASARPDDVRDRERFARTGHAEQRLVCQSGLESGDEALDRIRLIAGRLEWRNKLETIGHA